MKQDTVETELFENNAIIKEFIKDEGYPTDGHDGYDLQYHESIEWLWPVVEKIQHLKVWRADKKELSLFSNLSFSIDLCGYDNTTHCIITGSITHCFNMNIPHDYKHIEMPQISIVDKQPINAMYKAIVKFVKWYNQNQNTQQ